MHIGFIHTPGTSNRLKARLKYRVQLLLESANFRKKMETILDEDWHMLDTMQIPYELDKAEWVCGYEVIFLDLWEDESS
jgi:hypothetical protein